VDFNIWGFENSEVGLRVLGDLIDECGVGLKRVIWLVEGRYRIGNIEVNCSG